MNHDNTFRYDLQVLFISVKNPRNQSEEQNSLQLQPLLIDINLNYPNLISTSGNTG